MRCPVCGSNVPDGLDVCPACHADLAVTRVMPRLSGTWCPSCGALVPAGSTVCPKCGMPVDAPARPAPRRASSDERLLERERTQTLPRIESAIPSEPDASREAVYGRERLPHGKVLLVAALSSLIIVGGATLVITHPWDPTLSDTRATTPADTSQAGFPGTVGAIKGQDSTGVAQTVESADQVTFEMLSSDYQKLKDLSDRADASEGLFDSVATSGTRDERESGLSDAEQLAIEVSNLVDDISKIDTITTGTYTDQRDHVSTLASWLRNRVDALVSAWKLSAESDDPASDATKIERPMQGQRASESESSYAGLFAKNYEAWAPQQR